MLRLAALPLIFFLLAGCAGGAGNRGRSQSLVEIGEQSLERAEAGERLNRPAEANVLYRRALWAFRYHERLTGEQPLLLDDALAGAKRTARPQP
jgi:hypothetical protein